MNWKTWQNLTNNASGEGGTQPELHEGRLNCDKTFMISGVGKVPKE